MSAGRLPPEGAAPLLVVTGLRVAFGRRPVLDGVSFRLDRGEALAIVGESGSGKSVTARTLLGLADGGPAGAARSGRARVEADVLRLDGHDLLRPGSWRRVRGTAAGLILQDALVSLDPLRTVGREIDDALRLHTRLAPAARAARVRGLLESTGLDAAVAGSRSGELSGGMRQRALIASAIALDPPLLIADEPTTALDATVQHQVLQVLDGLRARGSALLLISHDLAVVASVADRIAVMRGGQIVEQGPAEQVLTEPRHEYTRSLLRAVPAGKPRGTRLAADPRSGPSGTSGVSGPSGPMAGDGAPPPPSRPPGPMAGGGAAPPPPGTPAEASLPVLEATGLTKSFRRPDGSRLAAVDGVDLVLRPGSTLGLVGESGSGKSTTARMILGLAAPDAGDVRLFGRPWSGATEAGRRPRRRQLGAVYQDPFSSFDPRMDVGSILADALSGGTTRRAARHRAAIAELLALVGLGEDVARRHPRTLSGGQRQRVAIARALAPQPRVLLLDEPVSALDVSVQAQILDLVDGLQERLGLSCLFISHDLAVVRHMSDEVAVMRAGRIVERGPTEEVFTAPSHDYTRALLAATPSLRG
ncbi:dipeptide ABC transporter ATP-binding protein [Zafaria sp. Z1313]|uniref:dipeptide ABC transporter ATP-binding protein n=1 Tax=Zafaria sp. Z1313 TaxID=3423202 RepID=UPI003D301A87